MTAQQEYDRRRYLANREERIRKQREYRRDYQSKGLHKPRPQAKGRKQRDHERYMEHHDEILAKQKAYREANKEAIKARRRQRDFERIYSTAKTT